MLTRLRVVTLTGNVRSEAEKALDMCLRTACYNGKVEAHVKHTVATQPELIQIATDWRREDDPAVLARNTYNNLNRNKDEDGQPQPCEHTREAIIAFGEGAGTITAVCTEKDCVVHGFRHVPTFTPEQLAAQKQRMKEEKARSKKIAERKAIFERIMIHIPPRPSNDELRFLLRALVYSSGLFEDVAVYFAELKNERAEQSDEEVLDGVITRANAEALSAVLARIALTDHIDIRREEQIDFLTEAASLFLPKEEPKPAATKKAAAKKATKSASKKVAKKASTKRNA